MSVIALKTKETLEKRKKRLEQEKVEETYEQVIKEIQEKNKSKLNIETNPKKRLLYPKNKNDKKGIIDENKLTKIRISEKKTQTLLEENGMLDGYKNI